MSLKLAVDSEYLHRDFLTMTAVGGLWRHLSDPPHVEGLHPFGFVWTKKMSYLQVMVSERPRGEPFELAAGE